MSKRFVAMMMILSITILLLGAWLYLLSVAPGYGAAVIGNIIP